MMTIASLQALNNDIKPTDIIDVKNYKYFKDINKMQIKGDFFKFFR